MKTYAGKKFPSRSDFDFDSKLLSAIDKISDDDHIRPKGAIPTQYIFDRAITRHHMSGSAYKLFPSALLAAEELLAGNPSKHKSNNPIAMDSIALANTITYYADEGEIFYDYIWKWEDDRGSLPVEVFSTAERLGASPPPGEVVANDTMERSEPYSPPTKVRSCCMHYGFRYSCISC